MRPIWNAVKKISSLPTFWPNNLLQPPV
jgi:hypothetical protein